MIKATFDLYNEDTKEETIEKEFHSLGDAYTWWNEQSGHPFLSYRMTGYENIG